MEKLYDAKRRQLAIEYNKKQDRNRIYNFMIMVISWGLFFGFSLENRLYNLINSWVNNQELQIILFIAIFYCIYSLLNGFISYFLSYKLKRYYNLSNQEVKDWLFDFVKSFILSLTFLYLVARTYLFLLGKWPQTWWISFTIIGTIFSIIITFLLPVILLPIFFKLTPYPDGSLKERIMNLISRVGVDVDQIYEINLSSKMNYANAAVIGLGKTRKIALGDNLKDKYTNAEVEAVMAHEIGHHVNGDIFKNMLVQPIILLVTSFIIHNIWFTIINWMGYESMSSIYTLPLLLVIWSFLLWLLSPLQNYLSRRLERKADEFALTKIENPESLATGLAKLADESLSELQLNLYKLLFKASHPPIGERVQGAIDWKKEKENI